MVLLLSVAVAAVCLLAGFIAKTVVKAAQKRVAPVATTTTPVAVEAVASVEPAEMVEKKASVGVIKIMGEITSIEDTVKQVMEYAQDAAIKGVLLLVDSGGGRCGSSELLFREIKSLANRKPVVTLIINSCSSGAYWAASASDWIVAQAASAIGSIGIKYTIEKHKNYKVTEPKYAADFDVTVVHTGKFKVLSDPNTGALNEQELAFVQGHTNSLYEIFTTFVAGARNLSLDTVSEWAEGKEFTGAQALKLGLVDQLGGYSDAQEKLQQLMGQRDLPVAPALDVC